MSTVLVPLQESAFAESILPDALQLAGADGKIVLVSVVQPPRIAPWAHQSDSDGETENKDVSDVGTYLSDEAQVLQTRGVRVETKVLMSDDIPRAIDEAVSDLHADMMAIATHGMDRSRWLLPSSLAWKTVAHSSVPILMRRFPVGVERDAMDPAQPATTVMVPLDGSARAEQALHVATQLAGRWDVPLLLAQVTTHGEGGQAYLDRIALSLRVPATTALIQGEPANALTKLAQDRGVSHVVLTSHGRTGLTRVIAGDVAAELIQQLPLPIVVVPLLQQMEKAPEKDESGAKAAVPMGGLAMSLQDQKSQ